ncbi:MAG: hypothetical protein LBG52_01480 [Candidatus Peribacteria bacterium]|jgi:hypothetical protein|nr:hypothetical protein [Candidatus Peribacteria bacterium]
MDESGDLGFDFFKAMTSQHFIVTFVFTENKKDLARIVKKTVGELSKKNIKESG